MSKVLFLFHEFISFIKNPIDKRKKSLPQLKNIIAGFIILDIILLIPAILALGGLTEVFNINPDSKVEDMFKESPILFAFGAIILAPLLEELVFRFFIRLKYAFYFVIPVKIVGSIIGAGKFTIHKWLLTYWKYLFPIVFYGSSILFGFVHIFNFENAESYLWYFPLLTLPQILLGLIFGYARIAYGYIYAMLFHSIHNSLFVLPYLIYYLTK